MNIPTRGDDFIYRDTSIICHETNGGENYKSSKETGATIHQGNNEGMAAKINPTSNSSNSNL